MFILNISLILEYCGWGTTGDTGSHTPLFWVAWLVSLRRLSSVEAKIFEHRRWVEDGHQLPGTLYLKPSFREVSRLGSSHVGYRHFLI